MVRRIAQLLTSEVRGLHEAAYLLGVFALLSQFLALVRDRLFASTFGAGSTLDLYYAAFKIPDLLFVSIASFISIYVLIPILSDSYQNNQAKTREVLDSIFTIFFIALVAVSAVVFWFMRDILQVIFPGFNSDQIAQVSMVAQILLLQPLLLGLSNLLASLTQLKGRFILYATSPLVYNLGIIFGVLFLYPVFGLPGLAYGVVLGAFLHLGIQVPFIVQSKLLPKFTFKPNFSIIRQVISLSLPRTLTLAANQILLMIFIAIASLLSVGSISVLQFAFNLQSVPLAIIGVSYSVAAFPTLAQLFSAGDRYAFSVQITQAMRAIIFWSVPVLVMVVVLRAQIVRVILGSGEFDWDDTRLVAAALAMFVISLFAQALVMLLVRGFYAAGNTRTPLLANMTAVCVSLVVAGLGILVFTEYPFVQQTIERLFRVEGIPGTSVLMLPLAYTIGMLANLVMLLILFERWYGVLREALVSLVLKVSIASLGAGLVAYVVLNALVSVVDINTFVGIFSQGVVAGMSGLLAWLITLKVLKSDELEQVLTALSHKFWKQRTVVPEEN